MDRRFWIGVLIVFALGATVFGFAQNQSLNQTQASLVVAQNTATALSKALVQQATAGAGTQVAAATEALAAQSQAVDDAQNAAATALAQAVTNAQNAAAVAQANALTDAQNMAATTQAQAVSDAHNTDATTVVKAVVDTQNTDATAQAQAVTDAQNAAATTQAKALADAQKAAATTQAQALTDLETPLAATQAKAVEDVQNAASTSQAALSEAESTSAAAQAAVSQAVDNAAATGQAAAATQQALEDNLATANAQLAASIPTASSASPTLPPTFTATPTPTAAATAAGTPAASAGTPAPGWTQIVGKGVTLELPESFTGFNLLNGSAAALADKLRALGPDFATAANFVEQNPDVFVLLAYDTRSKANYATNVLVLKQDVVVAPPMKTLLDATIAQLPSQITVLDSQIVQVGNYQAGVLTSETTITNIPTRQIEYFIIEGTHLWVIVFTTSADEYADRLPVFQQSIQSIQFVPAS